MNMTFENIDPPEHPAKQAARLIKGLHQKNLDMIASGHVFHRTIDGVRLDVTELVKKKCEEQLVVCDEIMSMADGMSHELTEQARKHLGDLVQLTTEMPIPVPVKDDAEPMLPEVGGYDHKAT